MKILLPAAAIAISPCAADAQVFVTSNFNEKVSAYDSITGATINANLITGRDSKILRSRAILRLEPDRIGMKIAIIGSGSIGLYYGAKLAAAGEEVHFLLRSGYGEAAREGIRVFSPDGDLLVRPVNAHREPAEIGPSDLVLVSLKTTQNDALAKAIPPLLGPDTMLLTLQNGLGSDEALAAQFGADRVLGALCFVCLTRRSPAQVDHFGHGTISIGELDRSPQPRTERVAEAFRRAGIETRVVKDLAGERWKKLVWNIPFNGLAVAEGGVAVDILLAKHLDEVTALMRETISIAAALGHAIRPGFIDFQIERTEKMGPYQPSTLVDYLAGRELEIDSIWGEPLRRAKAMGVPTPHLERLHSKLNALIMTNAM